MCLFSNSIVYLEFYLSRGRVQINKSNKTIHSLFRFQYFHRELDLVEGYSSPLPHKKNCLRARVKFKVSLRTAAPTPLSKTSAMVVYNGTNKFKQRPNSA